MQEFYAVHLGYAGAERAYDTIKKEIAEEQEELDLARERLEKTSGGDAAATGAPSSENDEVCYNCYNFGVKL